MRLLPTGGESQYELMSRLELKPGRYLLRYSVRSESLDKTGSVYTDLTVPDFSKAALSLSGIVLSATPAPRTAPADGLAPLIPVVPTTERVFSTSHEVTAFVRVYQGGKRPPQAVAIEARLTDRRGEENTIRAGHLAAGQFGAQRAADYTVVLPVGRLAPGPYLLTVSADAGGIASIRGHVRFSVR
jgi:hypothetical protein